MDPALPLPVPKPSAIVRGLETFRPVTGRLATLQSGAGATVIDDTYNANPDSVRVAVDVLGAAPHLPRALAAGEYLRDLWRPATAEAISRMLPGIEPRDLEPAPAGIRAQLLDRAGGLVDDFVLQAGPGVIHVRNAPSPAATACLAIGQVIAGHAVQRFLPG